MQKPTSKTQDRTVHKVTLGSIHHCHNLGQTLNFLSSVEEVISPFAPQDRRRDDVVESTSCRHSDKEMSGSVGSLGPRTVLYSFTRSSQL